MNRDNPYLKALQRVGARVTPREGPEFSPDALKERGWQYRDFPRMKPEMWSYLKTAFGKEGEHYQVLTEVSYPDGTQRGQLMLSPTAIENMKAYALLRPMPGAPLAS